ncbi:MAG: DEAD/DEAH box helicase [Thermodesulfovibrionales bacterium]
MVVTDLGKYGGSLRLINILSSSGVEKFYPPQVMAIKAGLLKTRRPFVISAPTASGKTLIAEMTALQAIERGGKVVYLVPLRALAREKYEVFSKKYKDCGIKIMQSTGDYDSADPWLYNADIIISTNEKMDSLLRHRASWLKDIEIVIADEIHLIGDSHRGPTLEMVLTRLKWMNPHLRILALSATIPNAADISKWLDAKLVESDWRPVPLREGVFFNEAIIFNDGTVKWVERESELDIINLSLQTIRDGGQVLIFLNTRKATEAVAKSASKYIAGFLSKDERITLFKLSEEVLRASLEPTRLCKKLSEYVLSGVAFHHAGINSSQRRLIEDSFRANRIKLVAATTTLAMGLNLPSRRVIIRDWWRYEPGLGMQPLPVIEIKQMSGRAGRPGLDEYGEAVIIAKNKRDEDYLFKRYIKGKPEDIESQIGNEAALRTHILASIAGLFTKNRLELLDFMRKTFYASKWNIETLSLIIDDILDFLISEEMVIHDEKGLRATRFGHRVSDLYIDPLTGVVIRDALNIHKEKSVFSFLHMIASTPDMMTLPLRKRDIDETMDVFNAHFEELLIPDDRMYPSEEILSQLKVASVLMQWIEETHEDKITSHFGIGPGDLRTLIELSDWLIYSSLEIGKVFNVTDIERPLSILRIRVLYGIKEELLQLVTLKGIGRIRARSLYNAGFKVLSDIRKASIRDLEKVPSIGRSIAEDIKRQVLT